VRQQQANIKGQICVPSDQMWKLIARYSLQQHLANNIFFRRTGESQGVSCLLAYSRSIARSHRKIPPHTDRPATQTPASYATGSIRRLAQRKSVTRFATMTRLGCSFSRISYSKYVVSSEIGLHGLRIKSLKEIIIVIYPMNRQLTYDAAFFVAR
jgi:hypothetical protein